MRLGERVATEFDRHGPELANTFGEIAFDASKKFGQMWWDAGPLGKIATAGVLGAKFGLTGPVFGAIGRKGAGEFRSAFGGKKTAGSWKAIGGKAGAVTGAGFALGLAAGIVLYHEEIGDALEEAIPGFREMQRGTAKVLDVLGLRENEVSQDVREAGTEAIRRGDRDPIGGAAPPGGGGRGRSRKARAAAPVPQRQQTVLHDSIYVDGRKIASVIRRIEHDRQARR